MLSELRNRIKNEVFTDRIDRSDGITPEDHTTLTTEQTDHLLEQLWMAEEDGVPVLAAASGKASSVEPSSHADIGKSQQGEITGLDEHIPTLLKAKLAELNNGQVALSAGGKDRAKMLIRRHRLTEMLLSEILDLSDADDQTEVCRLEHAIGPRITDRICAFLGHPPTCPHGRPIPRGVCCLKTTKEVPPLVEPLTAVRVGEDCRIVYIAPKRHARLDRLAVLGIIPGAEIHLHQKKPSFVVRVAETDIAIDSEIAREIYVRPK